MKNSKDQCVAIIGPPGRRRECARRALRWLGIAPFLFDTVSDFRDIGQSGMRFQLILFSRRPRTPVLLQKLVDEVRVLTRDSCSIHAFATTGPDKPPRTRFRPVKGAIRPPSFADYYQALQATVAGAGLSVAPTVPHWAPYRFLVAQNIVMVHNEPVVLSPWIFDLVLELFVNAGRRMSSMTLNESAFGLKAAISESVLTKALASLQSMLGLDSSFGWLLSRDDSKQWMLARAGAAGPIPTSRALSGEPAQFEDGRPPLVTVLWPGASTCSAMVAEKSPQGAEPSGESQRVSLAAG